MTAQKERCSHECVCYMFVQSYFVGNSPCLETCEWDTRSRPLPAPAPQNTKFKIIIVNKGDTIQLTTPNANLVTCVYVTLSYDGKLVFEGGKSIIEAPAPEQEQLAELEQEYRKRASKASANANRHDHADINGNLGEYREHQKLLYHYCDEAQLCTEFADRIAELRKVKPE